MDAPIYHWVVESQMYDEANIVRSTFNDGLKALAEFDVIRKEHWNELIMLKVYRAEVLDNG